MLFLLVVKVKMNLSPIYVRNKCNRRIDKLAKEAECSAGSFWQRKGRPFLAQRSAGRQKIFSRSAKAAAPAKPYLFKFIIFSRIYILYLRKRQAPFSSISACQLPALELQRLLLAAAENVSASLV